MALIAGILVDGEIKRVEFNSPSDISALMAGTTYGEVFVALDEEEFQRKKLDHERRHKTVIY